MSKFDENSKLHELAELRRQNAELKAVVEKMGSEQKYFLLFEKSAFPATLTKLPKGIIVDVNEAFEQEFGFTKQEAVGKTSLQLGITPDEKGEREIREALIKSDSVRHQERFFFSKSGEKRYYENNIDKVTINGEEYLINTIQDISEYENIKNKLEDSYNLLRIAGEKAKLGGWKIILKENRVYWSDVLAAFHEMPLGQTPLVEEAINLCAPEWRDKIEEAYNRCVNEGLPINEEIETITSAGKRVWGQIIGEAIKDHNGKTVEIQGAFLDITERKSAEAAFEEYFENDISANSVSMVSGDIVSCNRTFLDLFGFEKKTDTENFNIINLYKDPVDRKHIIHLIKQNRRIENFEIEFVSKEGKTIYALLNSIGIFDKNNNLEKIRSYIVDISRQKNVEKELLKLSRAIEQSPVSVIVTDLNGNIAYANPKALAITGYSQEELIGENPRILNSGEKPKSEYEKLWETISSGKEWVGEFHNKKKNGELYWELATISPVFNNKHEIINYVAVKEDITERKKFIDDLKAAKEKVEESEEKFRNLYESLSISYLILKDGICIECNEATLPIYGIDNKEEIIGKMPSDFSPEFQPNHLKSSEEAKRHIQEAIEKGENTFEWITKRKNKQEFYSEVSLKRFYYNNKLYLQCLIADISERKKNEAELIAAKENSAENELFLSTLINTLPDLVWLKDINGVYLMCNKRFEEFVGAPEHEIIGRTDYDLMKTDLADFFRQKDREAVEAGKPVINEELIVFASDKHSEYLETIKTSFYRNEQLVGVLGIGRNITERKNAEIELMKAKENVEESERKFRNLYESLSIAYLILKDGVCIECNETALEIYGVESKEEIIGKSPIDFSPEYQSNNVSSFDEAIKQTEIALEKGYNTFEWLAMRKNKELFYNEVSLKKFYYKNELHLQCLTTDITERKRIENELIAAKERAEESDRLKSTFLTNMSHEIRTPMNGILGFTNLLLEPDLSEDTREEYIDIIHKSGERMLNTVNDIVEISKIESGLVELRFEIIDLNNRVEELVKFFNPEANSKGLKIILEKLLPAEKKNIFTDKNKLDSILTNLIKNAIKYTPDGTISIGFQIKETDILLYINDTGIGIPNHRQNAIFNRFEQADNENTRVFEGSGLGLAIAKSYVEMLGGEIWVESVEGKGSTFYFTLPITNNSLEKPINNDKITSDTKNVKTIKIKIIIAEDDATSREYLSLIIKDYCREILEVETGIETVELCRSNPDIDLILMDIQMPGINGYEATRQIREFNSDVIIIAQTAYALSGDREKSIAAGCNDYISKPIDRTKLGNLLQKYFGR